LLVNLQITAVVDWFAKRGETFILFTGSFEDFTPYWYNAIGITILMAILINIFSAQAAYLMLQFMKNLRRCMDSGCCCDGKSTKKVTKRQYIDLYTGDNFDIGMRYSEVIIRYVIRINCVDSFYHFCWTTLLFWNAVYVRLHFLILVFYLLD